MGNNENGQLGGGGGGELFQQIDIENQLIVDISAGGQHSGVILEDGSALLYGKYSSTGE